MYNLRVPSDFTSIKLQVVAQRLKDKLWSWNSLCSTLSVTIYESCDLKQILNLICEVATVSPASKGCCEDFVGYLVTFGFYY